MSMQDDFFSQDESNAEKPKQDKGGRRYGGRVSVLVPLPVDTAYTYGLQEGESVAPGMFVRVSVGPRLMVGVVWDDAPDMAVAEKRLKPVEEVIDLPPMEAGHRAFIDRVARYTVSARGSVLKMSLSAPAALAAPKTVTVYALPAHLAGGAGGGLLRASTPKRQKALDILAQAKAPMPPSVLSKKSGVSTAVLKAMAQAGELSLQTRPETPPCVHPLVNPRAQGAAGRVDLSPDQALAAQEMVQAVRDAARAQDGGGGTCEDGDSERGNDCLDGGAAAAAEKQPAPLSYGGGQMKGSASGTFRPILLDGVTGSGKTEVYFEAVAAALAQGRQALVMLPEIALSNAFLDRFEKRFGCAPALWHSALSPAQRRKTWRGVAEGRTKVVIGARSALFLPYARLGVIVVDEEHDAAFKQEDGVLYHARDMAVLRAHIHRIPVILVSATPSLETIHNVLDRRYGHLVLDSRYGDAAMPDITLINMRQERLPRSEFISVPLRNALARNFADGRQSLLFLNRRGYAPLTICRSCGHRYECPQCTAWLVEHRAFKGRGGVSSTLPAMLQCHHCGYSGRMPRVCTECAAEDSLVPCGPGVERIEEEVKALFPQMRSIVLASDTAEGGDDFFTSLEKIRAGAVDIIIGTQIIAKGHHFPNLTCVGVIDADIGLKGGDLRASERTWQLLHQVAGRAGRGEHEGRVYVQTYMPDNRLMVALAADDREAFLGIELNERKMAHMPPYSRLAALIVSGTDEEKTAELARALGILAPHGAQGLRVLGPAPAPMFMLRGRYRFRFLVQSDKRLDLQKALKDWVASVTIGGDLRVQIDIDPQSFF